MKNTIRRVARSLARIPLLGRLVHVLAAMYRLPLIRAELEHLNAVAHRQHDVLHHDQHLLNAEVVPALRRIETGYGQQLPSLLDAVQRLEAGYKQQLPSLLDAISDINERQRILDVDHQNLTKSAPIELRALRRDVIRLDERLAEIQRVADRVDALKAELSEVRGRLEQEQAGQREAAVALQASVDVLAERLGSNELECASLIQDIPRSLRELKRDISSVGGSVEDTNPFGDRIEALANQIADLESARSDVMQLEAAEVKEKLESLGAHVRAIESNVGGEEVQRRAQARLDALERENGKVWERVEFIRRELMFEMRYGGGAGNQGGAGSENLPKIIEPDTVDSARKQGLRLNIGCGHVQPEGYVNVDLRELPGIHVLAEASRLPFGSGEVREIYSAHLLEHFPEEQLKRRILPYWADLLARGGELRVVVPDAEAMIKHYVEGTYPYDDLREVIYGAQDYDGDFHYNMFTPEHLVRLLTEAGFEGVVVVESGRQNGKCFEFELRARREYQE